MVLPRNRTIGAEGQWMDVARQRKSDGVGGRARFVGRHEPSLAVGGWVFCTRSLLFAEASRGFRTH